MTDRQIKTVINKQRETINCPGCGEEITADTDVSKIEYVRTKRKTDIFFHTACFRKVRHPEETGAISDEDSRAV